MATTLTVFITLITAIFFLEFVTVVGKFETSPTTIINECISYSKPYVVMAGYYAAEGLDYLGYYLSSLREIIYEFFQWLSNVFHKIYKILCDFLQWLCDIFYLIRQILRDFWLWITDLFSQIIDIIKNFFEWLQHLLENIKQFFSDLFNNIFENLIQTFKNFFESFYRIIALSEDFRKGIYNYLEEKYNYFSNVISDKINSLGSVNNIISNNEYIYYCILGAYAFLLFLILLCSILMVTTFCLNR